MKKAKKLPGHLQAQLILNGRLREGGEDPDQGRLEDYVRQAGQEPRRHADDLAQAVGDVPVEGPCRRDVAGHGDVPHREDGQNDGGEDVARRGARPVAETDGDGYVAGHRGDRGRRGDRHEDDLEETHRVRLEPVVVPGAHASRVAHAGPGRFPFFHAYPFPEPLGGARRSPSSLLDFQTLSQSRERPCKSPETICCRKMSGLPRQAYSSIPEGLMTAIRTLPPASLPEPSRASTLIPSGDMCSKEFEWRILGMEKTPIKSASAP